MAFALDETDSRRLGRELRRARERRGMTQKEAAGVIDAARTTMTAIEKGDRPVRADELMALAEAYGTTVNKLLRDRPEIADFRIEHRNAEGLTDEERASIRDAERTFEDLCRDYLELERIVQAPGERDEPPTYRTEGISAEEAAKDIARRERNRLGLGDGPLGDIRSLLEEKVGVRIFCMEMRPFALSSLYYYDDHLGACIAVNRLHSSEQQRWALARSYMYFLTDRYQPVAYVEGTYERRSHQEQIVDQGALHLLMPSSEVRARRNTIQRSKGRLTAADLCIMAQYFGVPVPKLTRRLENMRVLKTGTWRALADKGFAVREVQAAFHVERPDVSDELPFRYKLLALEALHAELISEKQFADFLRVSRLDARDEALRLLEGATEMDHAFDVDLSQPLSQYG